MMSRSIGENLIFFLIFFELSPFEFEDLDWKFVIMIISKTITARSFKLGQLIEDDE